MTNRRDLLKYFGVGTVIAPIIGASPIAKLIEVPKVEIIEAPSIPQPLNLADVKQFSIHFEMKDGSTRTLAGRSLFDGKGIIEPRVLMADVWIAAGLDTSPSHKANKGFIASEVQLL